MKRIFLSALLLTSIIFCQAQALKKYAIGNSGCSVYMLCDPGKFDEDYSEDSSKVFTAECLKDNINYGVICVKLLLPVNDLSAAEGVAISYLDYLKAEFDIKTAVGYGKGHRLNNNENTRGIMDYWTDSESANWKIKAWTDGKFICVLYANSKKELPDEKVDVFLNSLRLPGM
ncbi:MAG: hypothetical protein JJE22_03800 [Bacteroidia bacterium]|nr:hypothetical protein [Bacteroidia bacterium]